MQLALFEKLQDLEYKLNSGQIHLIKVGTGSGKSTLIPPLLLALGFKRVIVTQPRRLPCQLIYKRVSQIFGENICGWIVSGKSKNEKAPLLYVTDGIAKNIIVQTKKNENFIFDVIIFDEVHERGRNIDLSIGYMSYKLEQKNDKKTKVILCSATVDKCLLNSFAENKFIRNEFIPAKDEYDMSKKLVKEFILVERHPIDLANELSAELDGDEQMLVFLSGYADVQDAVNIFKKKYNKKSYPLIANQKPKDQAEYLQKGQIFFSTTIAETSLTFKNLKFVIDSGQVRSQKFDEDKNAYDTIQMLIAQSSISQRKGRLGRLGKEGKYYLCSNKQNHQLEYQQAEMLNLDLSEIMFQLLVENQDLNIGMEILMRTPISQEESQKRDLIKSVEQSRMSLRRMGIIDRKDKLTDLGKEVVKIPIVSDPKLIISLYFALTSFKCGLNIIILISILYIMPTTYQSLLAYSFSSNGDIEALIHFIHKCIINNKNNQNINKQFFESLKISDQLQSNINKCIQKVNSTIQQFIAKSIFPYQCQTYSNKWENVAKALLNGYQDYTFINLGFLGGNNYYYQRIVDNLEFQYDKQQQITIDQSSKLFQKNSNSLPQSYLALQLFYNSVSQTLGTAKLLGIIQLDWLERKIKRSIYFKAQDNKSLLNRALEYIGLPQYFYVDPNDDKKIFINEIQSGQLLKYQNEIDKKLRRQFDIELEQMFENQLNKSNQPENNKQIIKMNFEKLKETRFNLFIPIILRYSREYQIKIDIKSKKNEKAKIVIENSHEEHIEELNSMFKSFLSWFIRCKQICLEDNKVDLRSLNKDKCNQSVEVIKEIEKRIERVTKKEIEKFELKQYVSQNSSRIQRMELVAWILINQYDCILKGGFVRDWIVGGRADFPAGVKLEKNPFNMKEEIMDERVCPKDLDVILPFTKPKNKIFDPDEFTRKMKSYGLEIEVDSSDYWRHFCIFDRHSLTGAFTVDIIESFCHICHDRIDFDVNNLYVKSGYTKDLGMIIPLNYINIINQNQVILSKSQNITLENIVDNIIKKQFRVLRSDVEQRIKKMIQRNWKQDPTIYELVIPDSQLTICERIIDTNDQKYKLVQTMMTPLLGNNSKIQQVFHIKNNSFDNIYEGLKRIIANNNDGNSNEKMLFHGTSEIGSEGITKANFENSYYKPSGMYGSGAYFADDPKKSHSYTQPNPNKNNERIMFICNVILGKEQILNKASNNRHAPDIGFDSVIGKAGSATEYIVYKYGQAKPLFRVHYI